MCCQEKQNLSTLNQDYVKVCFWTFFLCQKKNLMCLLQFKELEGIYKLKAVSCLKELNFIFHLHLYFFCISKEKDSLEAQNQNLTKDRMFACIFFSLKKYFMCLQDFELAKNINDDLIKVLLGNLHVSWKFCHCHVLQDNEALKSQLQKVPFHFECALHVDFHCTYL